MWLWGGGGKVEISVGIYFLRPSSHKLNTGNIISKNDLKLAMEHI